MDLNQAYFDHQLSLIRAEQADTPCLEHGHRREAAQIAGRIGARQGSLGALAAGGWMRDAAGETA